MEGKLGAVMLYAEDPVGLASWYHEVLGLPPAKQYEDAHLGCVHHDMYFGFNRHTPQPAPGSVSLWFLVDDCDAEFGAVRARGGQVVHEPHDTSWGARVCCFLDPAGNRVWLYTYLPKE